MNKGFAADEQSMTVDDNDDDNNEKSFIARLKVVYCEMML